MSEYKPKYGIDDVVLLTNGKIRRIEQVQIDILSNVILINYTGKWWQSRFSEHDIAKEL